MLIDLHAYSRPSGGLPLDELVAASRSRGIDGILVADRSASSATAALAARLSDDTFQVFVGVEIETRSGDVIVVTPALDPFLTREEWKQLSALEKPTLDDVAALAEAEGGVVLLCQPYDRNRTGAPRDRMFALKGLAGVEVGSDTVDYRTVRTTIEAVKAWTVPGFGGSARKARGRAEGQWLTLFAQPVKTQAGLVEAIKAGDFWALEVRDGSRPPEPARPPRDDRGPRPDDRGPRRDDRGPRPAGERRERSDGDRGPRPEGERRERCRCRAARLLSERDRAQQG
jgi:predicted metal-dependent phosphoesterase TrpH